MKGLGVHGNRCTSMQPERVCGCDDSPSLATGAGHAPRPGSFRVCASCLNLKVSGQESNGGARAAARPSHHDRHSASSSRILCHGWYSGKPWCRLIRARGQPEESSSKAMMLKHRRFRTAQWHGLAALRAIRVTANNGPAHVERKRPSLGHGHGTAWSQYMLGWTPGLDGSRGPPVCTTPSHSLNNHRQPVAVQRKHPLRLC